MSLPRVLPQPIVTGAAEPLVDVALVLPADVRRRLDEERAAAYARGRDEGLAEGTAAALAQVEDAIERLRVAVTEETARFAAARSADDDALVDVAVAIAGYVVGAAAAASADDLVDGIRAALADIDDVDVVAHVAPAQAELVEQLLGDEIRVERDPSVAEGETRLVGRWSVASLTRHDRWAAVQEVLDARG